MVIGGLYIREGAVIGRPHMRGCGNMGPHIRGSVIIEGCNNKGASYREYSYRRNSYYKGV